MEIIPFSDINDKIIVLRNQQVLLNSDVAVFYGVETREINQAVKNNPDKFPRGYIFELDRAEQREVINIFDNPRQKYSPSRLSAFTEKGLYMLATILRSPQATRTTLAIVEAFAQLRELSRTIAELSEVAEEEKQKSLMQRSGEIMSDLLGSDLRTTDTETTVEMNFAVLKFKHTVKRKE